MALFYNTPHTSWQNRTSYWIPLRIMAHAFAVIQTTSSSSLKLGKKWVGIDVTSERVD